MTELLFFGKRGETFIVFVRNRRFIYKVTKRDVSVSNSYISAGDTNVDPMSLLGRVMIRIGFGPYVVYRHTSNKPAISAVSESQAQVLREHPELCYDPMDIKDLLSFTEFIGNG